jgi:hypothetical protein
MRSALLIGLLVAASTAAAQTNDPNWRSWEWAEDIDGPRAAGMGGAFVGVADDSESVFLNPAGMALLDTSLEIRAGIQSRGAGTLPNGDSSASRFGFGFIGGCGKLTKTVAIGGYLREPHDQRIRLLQSASGGLDTGYLDTTITDVGVAGAWHVLPRLYVGGRINVTHLRLQGLLTRSAGVASYTSGTASAEDRIAGDAGALLQISEKVALGASFTQGAVWDASRTANGALGEEQPVNYQVSSPSRFAVGLSGRPNERFLLSAQVDYLLLGRLHDTFRVVRAPVEASEYQLDNGVEFRAGAEVSLPVKGISVQVRGGIYSQAPGAFLFTGTTPASERDLFVGVTRRTLGTAGASIVTRTLRLDVSGAFGGQRTVIAAGAALRF